MELVAYKIRDTKTGSFSKGAVNSRWDSADRVKKYYICWDNKGKNWTSEKLVKAHLLKCAQLKILSDNWEVIQVTYSPTKPLDEWIDSKMLAKILKS